jgi:hypothetical protein
MEGMNQFRIQYTYTWKCHNETLCVEILNKSVFFFSQKNQRGGCPWLTPVVLSTQEAEIRRIAVRSQPGQIVRKTLSRKKKALVE